MIRPRFSPALLIGLAALNAVSCNDRRREDRPSGDQTGARPAAVATLRQAPAQTPAPKPDVTVAPLEKLRGQIQTTLYSTRPDFVVFVPQVAADGVTDTGNEHFLVFDGPDKSLMVVWTQSKIGRASCRERVYVLV